MPSQVSLGAWSTQQSRLAGRASDWLNQERAYLARFAGRLSELGVVVEIVSGVSEDGDPWCCFLDPEKGEALVHFSRIDSEVIAVHLPRDAVMRGGDLREVGDRVLASVLSLPANQYNPAPVAALGDRVVQLNASIHSALEMSHLRHIRASQPSRDGLLTVTPDVGERGHGDPVELPEAVGRKDMADGDGSPTIAAKARRHFASASGWGTIAKIQSTLAGAIAGVGLGAVDK